MLDTYSLHDSIKSPTLILTADHSTLLFLSQYKVFTTRANWQCLIPFIYFSFIMMIIHLFHAEGALFVCLCAFDKLP